MIGFWSKLAVVLVLLIAVFVMKHEHFVAISLSIGMLSIVDFVFYFKWWLKCYYHLMRLQGFYPLDSASYWERSQMPPPPQWLPSLLEWVRSAQYWVRATPD